MVNKVINEKERPIKYSDRKQINVMSILNMLRIVYYLCAIIGIFYLAFVSVDILHSGIQKQNNNIMNTDDIYIFDGDTISYHDEKIRLLCINTPEIENTHKGTPAEPYAYEAKDTLIDFVEANDQVIKECSGRDKYGRELCELFGEDGNNIGLAMVRYGEAKVFLCNKKEYYQAEREAQKKHRGIWGNQTG